mmetsp:Transcript_72525/g.182961  ORF Transcript_72525/g.182961 Transcript_72525/m.182961 type:complete len:253 (-) Transcript_72525:366-1124(-)
MTRMCSTLCTRLKGLLVPVVCCRCRASTAPRWRHRQSRTAIRSGVRALASYRAGPYPAASQSRAGRPRRGRNRRRARSWRGGLETSVNGRRSFGSCSPHPNAWRACHRFGAPGSSMDAPLVKLLCPSSSMVLIFTSQALKAGTVKGSTPRRPPHTACATPSACATSGTLVGRPGMLSLAGLSSPKSTPLLRLTMLRMNRWCQGSRGSKLLVHQALKVAMHIVCVSGVSHLTRIIRTGPIMLALRASGRTGRS